MRSQFDEDDPQRRLRPSGRSDVDDAELSPPNSADLWIGLETPSVGAWGLSAKVKLRPAVRTKFRLSGTNVQMITELRLRLAVKIAFGIEKRHGIEVELEGRYEPFEATADGEPDAAVELKITFLRW